MLADLPVGDRIVRKADGGRRPEAIREIPVQTPLTEFSRARWLLDIAVFRVPWCLCGQAHVPSSPSTARSILFRGLTAKANSWQTRMHSRVGMYFFLYRHRYVGGSRRKPRRV